MVSNYTLQQIPIEIEMMSEDSRVWIFQMDRELSPKEVFQATEYLRVFSQEWTSHNNELRAFGTIFYNRFIVMVLDEQASNTASGCSIDSMTKHIQHLGAQLGVNVLDREQFYFMDESSQQLYSVHMHGLTEAFSHGMVNRDSLVFNNLIKSKKELFKDWLVPLHSSWQFRFV